MILSYGGVTPRIHRQSVLLEPVVVTGDVEVGPESSIWFGCVVRGDMGPVRIGARSNVQDGCIIHGSVGRTPCLIDDEVTVGHRAVVHGAHLKRRCLVGMGAIVLDGAVVGENAIVGAGALVPEGAVVPDGHLAVGVPARVKRPLGAEEIAMIAASAEHYVDYAKRYGGG